MKITLAPKTGFTLIELLVAIAIVAMIVALVLPAVFRAREAGRRIACVNNLKQIGLALQNYHGQNGMFPSAKYADFNIGSSIGSHSRLSPFVGLLPYLGESELFNQINCDPRINVDDYVHGTPGVFLCPSDINRFPSGHNNNYRVNLGSGPYEWAKDSADWPEGGTGAFVMMDFLRARDFTDGLSHTAGVSEKARGDGDDTRFSIYGDHWLPKILGPPFPKSSVLLDICSQTGGGWAHDSFGGSSWTQFGYRHTWYNHVMTPNSATLPDCAVQFQIQSAEDARPGGVFSARSRHLGGVNCAMMDGSVRFVSDSVDLDVWRAVGTRSGDESIESSSF